MLYTLNQYNYIPIKPGKKRFTATKVKETHVRMLPHISLSPYLLAILFVHFQLLAFLQSYPLYS